MAGLYHLKPPSAGLRHLRAVAPPLLRFFLNQSLRTYTTCARSAQPQLDPDYYYYNLDEEDTHQNHHESTPTRRSLPENLDTGGSVPLRGVQWVLIGSPGAKKYVYAEKLSKLLEVPHISLGSLVRQDLSPRSFLYKQIADAVNQGTLVPGEIIFGLLSKRLEDGHSRGETGFILNGIPRTQIQAEILDQLVNIDLVLNFKCMEDFPAEHPWLKYSMSRKKGTWNQKAHAYSKQIKQLEDYYKKKMKLLDIQVGSTPGETWQGLLGALGLHAPPVQS